MTGQPSSGEKSRRSTPAAAAEHRLELAVGAEIVDALDRHQLGQARAGAIDAALDRTDRAAANSSRFLVGKSRSADQDEGFALIRGQLGERGAEFLELDAAGLLRLGFEGLRIGAFTVGDLATTLAIFRAEKIAQDREQPCRHVGAGLERIEVRPGAQKSFLHEVVSTIDITGQRNRKGSQAWDCPKHRPAYGGVVCPPYDPLSSGTSTTPPPSRRRINSTKRSGTPWLTTSL